MTFDMNRIPDRDGLRQLCSGHTQVAEVVGHSADFLFHLRLLGAGLISHSSILIPFAKYRGPFNIPGQVDWPSGEPWPPLTKVQRQAHPVRKRACVSPRLSPIMGPVLCRYGGRLKSRLSPEFGAILGRCFPGGGKQPPGRLGLNERMHTCPA